MWKISEQLNIHYKKVEAIANKIINASNVFVSFMYWAFYLKGATVDRVWGVYDKMINSFNALQFSKPYL